MAMIKVKTTSRELYNIKCLTQMFLKFWEIEHKNWRETLETFATGYHPIKLEKSKPPEKQNKVEVTSFEVMARFCERAV